MYNKGQKEGQGYYKWTDGSSYDGEWFDNMIHGYGVYVWGDGRKYFGQWKQNNMEGFGVYFWADGRRFDGMYKDDKKDGFGIYMWADGKRYEGWWSNGKQHGLGIYIVPKESKHKYGIWENGKRKEWFNEVHIDQINSKTLDYTSFFEQPNSASRVRPYCTFNKPIEFDSGMKVIYKKLKVQQLFWSNLTL